MHHHAPLKLLWLVAVLDTCRRLHILRTFDSFDSLVFTSFGSAFVSVRLRRQVTGTHNAGATRSNFLLLCGDLLAQKKKLLRKIAPLG